MADEAKLMEIFDTLDQVDDGKIKRDELVKGLQQCGFADNAEEVANVSLFGSYKQSAK